LVTRNINLDPPLRLALNVCLPATNTPTLEPINVTRKIFISAPDIIDIIMLEHIISGKTVVLPTSNVNKIDMLAAGIKYLGNGDNIIAFVTAETERSNKHIRTIIL